MTRQLPLFQEESPRGKVWNAGDHWIATIDDWWTAQGKIREDAIRKVTANYEREMDALESGRL
jgi:hypothetical protein